MEPMDTGKGCDAFEMLVLFLTPYDGYELWLERFLALWDTYYNPVWSTDIMNLIGPTARNNIGKIDWEPYMPSIFTRVMRALELPVNYKNMSSVRNQHFTLSSAAREFTALLVHTSLLNCFLSFFSQVWIVSVLGPNSSAQEHLTCLMGAIETYVHPANTGKWLEMISDLLVNLVIMFERRLVDERFTKPSWIRPIPESHRLTETCITNFVICFRPVAMQAIYSRMNSNDVGKIFKALAELRPELIIPSVIERVFNNLDLLTEPHKLTASLKTLVRVSRPLVTGHNGYVEGRAQFIPILMALLPGLDPNDSLKTCLVLQCYVSFTLLVPMVDCSRAAQYYDDLTEEEALICEQTAVMEDFVLQFMDRIFVLIDASSSQTFRLELADDDNNMSNLEAITESRILSCVHTILSQSSNEIIALAAHKMIEFVRSHIFESKVAAALAGGMVRIMGRVAGHDYFKQIVPYLLNTLQEFFDEPDMANVRKQRDEFLYYLQLLLNVIRGDPLIVIDYVDEFLPVIDHILTYKCPTTATLANNMILHILLNFSIIQTDNVNNPEIRTKSIAEYLPIRHWGKTLEPNAKLIWFVPDQRCKELCERVIHRYLLPTLAFFERFISDEITPTKEEMLKNINVISALLRANNVLPNWTIEEGGELSLMESVITDYEFDLSLGFEDVQISMPDGSNIRKTIAEVMLRLQDKLLEKSEDDIKSLKALLQVWDRVHMRRHGNLSFEQQLKNYAVTKSFQDFRLTRQKRSIRCVVALRTIVQQHLRDELAKPKFTRLHEQIVKKLLKLSTSKYSVIRMVAQSRLLVFLGLYPFSYRCIMDDLVEILRLDTTEHHDQFKGALYLLNGCRGNRLLVKHDWILVRKLWTALLESQVSEKPSVTKLLDALVTAIKFDFPTLNIRLTFPDSSLSLARAICPNGGKDISPERIAAGIQNEEATNKQNESIYYEISNEIINVVKNKSLHWRYNFMASSMLLNLVHPNVKQSEIFARYFLHNLLSDSLPERKVAVQAVSYIMLQQKREHKKIVLDVGENADRCGRSAPLRPGVRSDNRWLQYELDRLPRSQADWDEPRYLFKPHGFFGWSDTVEVYAPTSQQPNVDWTRDEMNDVQQVIYDFFRQRSNVEGLLKFWSLEEKKGQDQFRRNNTFLIRSLCGMFGDAFNFGDMLPEMIARKEVEGNHRCAAEVLAGLIRGCKHWPYEKAKRLYEGLVVPMIRHALNNVTPETDAFWESCFSTACENSDPLRQHWLYETLMEEPLRQTTSHIDCSRIFAFQNAINKQVWRMNSVAHRLMDYFMPHLGHPFQNVRQAIGFMLVNIMEMDFQYPDGPKPECPLVADFLREVLKRIQILQLRDYPLQTISGEGGRNGDFHGDEEYLNAVRTFKTVAYYLTTFISMSTNGNRSEYFDLLPFACRLERCEQDPELAAHCTKLLSMLSHALTLPDCMPVALKKIDEVSRMTSWSSRLAVIGVLQVLVFNNMTVVLSRREWIDSVQEIVLRLLEDKVVEVREMAAQVLGGLLHCKILPATDKLLELFKKKCQTTKTSLALTGGGPRVSSDEMEG